MPTPKRPLQITTRAPKGPDFKFELLPLHSPLLGQSLLVSFPPLIDMLKFSGYPYLIRGQALECGFLGEGAGAGKGAFLLRFRSVRQPPMHSRRVRARGGTDAQHQAELEGTNDARTGMP